MSFVTTLFGKEKVIMECWACHKKFKGPIGDNTCPKCLRRLKEGAEF